MTLALLICALLPMLVALPLHARESRLLRAQTARATALVATYRRRAQRWRAEALMASGAALAWLAPASLYGPGWRPWAGAAFALAGFALVQWGLPRWLFGVPERGPLRPGAAHRRALPAETAAMLDALAQRCGCAGARFVAIDDGGDRRNARALPARGGTEVFLWQGLLDALDRDGLRAVVAHELAHGRLHHHRRRRVMLALLAVPLVAMLAAAGLGTWPPATLALLPVLGFVARGVLAAQQRRFEHEADAFAVAQVGAAPLHAALCALYGEAAAIVTDRWLGACCDTHPAPQSRLRRLRPSQTVTTT
ncbi:M48 family metallopeptidase [Solimonas flava]|uniref:M48 family metallopeptidase n=1 Tax=Solimonas flava TaxID=415849 RepID=UPI0004175FF4|nr:M48 family metalloprotease [Solimonas flava]